MIRQTNSARTRDHVAINVSLLVEQKIRCEEKARILRWAIAKLKGATSQARHHLLYGLREIVLSVEVRLPAHLQKALVSLILRRNLIKTLLVSIRRVIFLSVFCKRALNDIAGRVKQRHMPKIARDRFVLRHALVPDRYRHRANHRVVGLVEEGFEGGVILNRRN